MTTLPPPPPADPADARTSPTDVVTDPTSDAPPSPASNHAAPPPQLAKTAIGEYMVREALISNHLRQAIEVTLRRRHRDRWRELIAEAEEVLQEVALRALDRLATFDHRASLALPWLMGIAINVMRERDRHPFGEPPGTVGQSVCSEEQWAAILGRLRVQPKFAEEPAPVWRAVERLDDAQKRIIRLRFVEGRPYAAVAQAFRISEDAARARVCRALQALRRIYTSETTL